jgi:uncharacterized protein YbcI
MVRADERSSGSILQAVSNAMVRLHKEQFGRGPTKARSHFAGPDAMTCVLEDALLPAELKMIQMGEDARVRDSRVSYQAATAEEFVAEVEAIVNRKVRAFGSAVDTGSNVVFENFAFESLPDTDGELAQDGHERGRSTNSNAS